MIIRDECFGSDGRTVRGSEPGIDDHVGATYKNRDLKADSEAVKIN